LIQQAIKSNIRQNAEDNFGLKVTFTRCPMLLMWQEPTRQKKKQAYVEDDDEDDLIYFGRKNTTPSKPAKRGSKPSAPAPAARVVKRHKPEVAGWSLPAILPV
jgi:hypothetical protein